MVDVGSIIHRALRELRLGRGAVPGTHLADESQVGSLHPMVQLPTWSTMRPARISRVYCDDIVIVIQSGVGELSSEPPGVKAHRMQHHDSRLVGIEGADIFREAVSSVPDSGVVVCGYEVNIGHV